MIQTVTRNILLPVDRMDLFQANLERNHSPEKKNQSYPACLGPRSSRRRFEAADSLKSVTRESRATCHVECSSIAKPTRNVMNSTVIGSAQTAGSGHGTNGFDAGQYGALRVERYALVSLRQTDS